MTAHSARVAVLAILATVGLLITAGGASGAAAINTDNMVERSVDLSNDSLYDLEVSPDGSRLYVREMSNDRVLIVDTVLGKVIGKVSVKDLAHLEVSPDGTRLYASSLDYGVMDSCVITEIDPRSARILRAMDLKGRCGRTHAAPDGKTLIVPKEGVGIAQVDLASGTVRDVIPLTHVGGSHALLNGGRWMVVNDRSRGSLVTYDLAAETTVGPEAYFRGSIFDVVAPVRGTIAYMATDGPAATLVALDVATGKRIGSASIGAYVDDIVITRDGATLYLLVDGHAWQIDAASLRVEAKIDVSNSASELEVSPTGKRLYAANAGGTGLMTAIGYVPSTVSYATTTVRATVGESVSPVKPTTGWLFLPSFRVYPELPRGLALNNSTGGALTGTPRVSAGTRTYTVVADDGLATARTQLTITVAKAPTSATLSLSSVTQSYGGSPARASVWIGPNSRVGTVAFFDGASKLATVKVVDGKAWYTLPRYLSRGVHSIKAVFTSSYPGSFMGATTKSISLTVR